MEIENIALFCADVGSIKNGNFGWAAQLPQGLQLKWFCL